MLSLLWHTFEIIHNCVVNRKNCQMWYFFLFKQWPSSFCKVALTVKRKSRFDYYVKSQGQIHCLSYILTFWSLNIHTFIESVRYESMVLGINVRVSGSSMILNVSVIKSIYTQYTLFNVIYPKNPTFYNYI